MNFTLDAYVAGLNEAKRRELKKLLSFGIKPENLPEWDEFIDRNVKLAFLSRVLTIVNHAVGHGQVAQINREEALGALDDMIKGNLVYAWDRSKYE